MSRIPEPPSRPGRSRAQVIQLSSSVRDLLGERASQEALNRMADATNSRDLEKALLWFDVWTELETPRARR